jgi:hypothetical protein
VGSLGFEAAVSCLGCTAPQILLHKSGRKARRKRISTNSTFCHRPLACRLEQIERLGFGWDLPPVLGKVCSRKKRKKCHVSLWLVAHSMGIPSHGHCKLATYKCALLNDTGLLSSSPYLLKEDSALWCWSSFQGQCWDTQKTHGKKLSGFAC